MSLVDTETGEVIQVPTIEELEEIIGRGFETFVEVGAALRLIRAAGLYLKYAPTFEDYCKQRWGLSRPRAYELIHAAEAVCAIADTDIEAPVPTSEAQARALRPLKDDPEAMASAMHAAVETATEEGRKTTAAHIKAAVADEVAKARQQAEQKKQDREELAALEAELQPSGFDPVLDGQLAEERGRLRRLCRDLASLPDPADLIERQRDYLDRLRTTAEVADKAYAWLDGFLSEMEDHR